VLRESLIIVSLIRESLIRDSLIKRFSYKRLSYKRPSYKRHSQDSRALCLSLSPQSQRARLFYDSRAERESLTSEPNKILRAKQNPQSQKESLTSEPKSTKSTTVLFGSEFSLSVDSRALCLRESLSPLIRDSRKTVSQSTVVLF